MSFSSEGVFNIRRSAGILVDEIKNELVKFHQYNKETITIICDTDSDIRSLLSQPDSTNWIKTHFPQRSHDEQRLRMCFREMKGCVHLTSVTLAQGWDFENVLFIISTEEMVARNASAQKVYLDEVRGCDVYLGIFGDRYGNVDAEGVSPTEREYDAATECGRYRIASVKKSGSGTGDIIKKCRDWGLPGPTYQPDAVDFKTIIWRRGVGVTPVATPVMTPVATPVDMGGSNRFEWIVSLLRERPMGSIELAEKLSIADPKNLRRRYAKVLMDDGVLEYTIPDKPNSRLQKYRLTAKGVELADEIRARK